MSPEQTLRARLVCQGLIGPRRAGGPQGAVDCVRHLVATSARNSRHAVAQRTMAREQDLQQAVAQHTLIQTHVLRPSRQVVNGHDLRWIQELTSGFVESKLAKQLDRLGLTGAVIGTSMYAIAYLLADSNPMTAADMAPHLAAHGLPSEGAAYQALLGVAALRGLTCYLDGSYLLVDDVLPLQPHLETDDAAARLARRFFEGHGPASLGDFARWSGMPLSLARRAQQALGDDLVRIDVNGLPHFAPRALVPVSDDAVVLLSLDDEAVQPFPDVPFPRRAPLPPDADGIILLGVEVVGSFRFAEDGLHTTLLDVSTGERDRIEERLLAG